MRKLVSTWILLSVVLATGRVALWVAMRTLDLRFPGLFELVVVPGVQVLVLLWVRKDLYIRPHLRTLPLALRKPPWRTAVRLAFLAALVLVASWWLGGKPQDITRGATLATGVLALLAMLACAQGRRDAPDGLARLDWSASGAFLALYGSNAIYPWLKGLTVAALPKGGGTAPATAVLTFVAVPTAIALVVRLDRRLLSPTSKQLLWSALGLGVFSVQLGFLLWLRAGTAPEAWMTLPALTLVATFTTLLVALLPPVTAPGHSLGLPVGRSAPSRIPVDWLALALAHLGVAAVMRLVIFPRWQPDLRTLLSITLVTGLQALALRALRHR
jgi:hypothetical protein